MYDLTKDKLLLKYEIKVLNSKLPWYVLGQVWMKVIQCVNEITVLISNSTNLEEQKHPHSKNHSYRKAKSKDCTY